MRSADESSWTVVGETGVLAVGKLAGTFLHFLLTIVACVLQAVRSSRRKNSINVNFQLADDSRLEASWATVVGTWPRIPVITSTDGCERRDGQTEARK